MKIKYTMCAVTLLLPQLGAAQSSPVADALRDIAKQRGANLMAAADLMPADKYDFKPTPAQWSYSHIIDHVAFYNDYFCSDISGQKAPERAKMDSTAGKDALTARLKETFDFCTAALGAVDDSKLGEQIPAFGGKTKTRGWMMMVTAADWFDHYTQLAIYLRLNGILPPTARPKA